MMWKSFLIMIIFSILLDVNECAVEQDLCDGNAYCVVYPNSISYSCQCKDGFEGDGFQCNKLGTCQLFLEIEICIVNNKLGLVDGLPYELSIVLICENLNNQVLRMQNCLE